MDLHLILYVEPVIEFCVNRLPEWCLTKHPYLWARQYLTPGSPLESKAVFAYSLMANLLRAGETLSVRLVLPGAVVKFGRQWLLIAFVGFVVSAESLVMLMYQVNVDWLSTNLSMHIAVRLIHVHPYLSHHIQSGH